MEGLKPGFAAGPYSRKCHQRVQQSPYPSDGGGVIAGIDIELESSFTFHLSLIVTTEAPHPPALLADMWQVVIPLGNVEIVPNNTTYTTGGDILYHCGDIVCSPYKWNVEITQCSLSLSLSLFIFFSIAEVGKWIFTILKFANGLSKLSLSGLTCTL
jgi:hypothetical protein